MVLNSQNNNLDPRTGTASATSATHAIQQMALIERAAVEEGDSFGVVYNSTGPSRHNNGNGDDLTPGWNVFVFLGAGLGRTTGSPMAPVVSLGWGSTPA